MIKPNEVPYSWIKKELVLKKTIKRGDKTNFAGYIQEWLCYHGFKLDIDYDFGPATERQVSNFQKSKGKNGTGVVDEETYSLLTEPMLQALTPITVSYPSFRETLLAYAEKHVELCPIEIGGQNMGPWVRLYMSGSEGDNYPWCAGFVSFLLQQSNDNSSFSLPISGSWSCDTLAAQAKEKKLFMSEREFNIDKIQAGSIFLCRRSSTDWTHTGIVTYFEKEVFGTIEGNTNDEGHREGYEACRRVRAYKEKDFIML